MERGIVMSQGLRISLIGMGLFFILLGLFLNFQLYTSFAGDSPVYKYSYGAIGVGLDVSKVICLILGAFLIRQADSPLIIAGFFSLAFYLVLSLISWAAGWGFTLVVTQEYEKQAFQQNSLVQAAQASVDDAIAEVKRLSQYAIPPNIAQAQAEELQNKLDVLWASPATNSLGHRTGRSVNSILGATCPGNSWYHRKYCPQIQNIQSKIAPHQTVLKNHVSYLAAIKHKNAMMKELSQMNPANINTASYMHPLFIGMAVLFGSTAELVKYRLLLLTSAMIEMLGGLFFVIGILLKEQIYTMKDMMAMEKQKYKWLDNWETMEKQRKQFLSNLPVGIHVLDKKTDSLKLNSTFETRKIAKNERSID
jgi:hypothetical protein